jgi:hypothetical protein
MARSAATVAENKPVYGVPVYAQSSININMRTHKKKDPISIFLPALDHLVVLVLCNFGVYREKGPRAVTEVGFSLRWLIRCRLGVVAVAICHRHS